MTTTWPGLKRIGWTAVLLTALAGLYLLLDGHLGFGSALSAVLGVLLIVCVLLGNLLAFAIRAKGRRRSITLPWFLLRRAIDVGLLITVGLGFFFTGHAEVQHSDSVGKLALAVDQTTVIDSVQLPAGDTAVWFAVHCFTCDHPGDHPEDATQYPARTRIAVSGPSTATARDVSGRLALDAVTNDQFGAREQRQIGLVHVAAAGRYTVHILIDANYYDEPAKYHSPAVKYYEHPQILLGTPQPPFIDHNRLNILTALLALSVLITLRPRRVPKTEQDPVRASSATSVQT
jgi:hypothetical protein